MEGQRTYRTVKREQEPIGLVGRMKNLQDGLMRRRTIGLVGRTKNLQDGLKRRRTIELVGRSENLQDGLKRTRTYSTGWKVGESDKWD